MNAYTKIAVFYTGLALNIGYTPMTEPKSAFNLIGGITDSVLALSAVDHRFKLRRVKPKTIKLVLAAFLQSTQHQAIRTD